MGIAGWNKVGSIWFTEDQVTHRLGNNQTPSPHCPMEGGFSLIEMMAVLAIIVALSAISIPSIQSGLSHLKLARAVDTFVDQIEFARSQAATRGRAYRVQVLEGSDESRGRIVVTEGWGTICNDLNFNTSGGLEPVDSVRDIDYSREHPWVEITSVSPDGIVPEVLGDYQGICFKPDGRVLQIAQDSSDGGQPITPAPTGYATGEAVFRLTLSGKDGVVDTNTSTARDIVVPYNGIPRVEKISDGGAT